MSKYMWFIGEFQDYGILQINIERLWLSRASSIHNRDVMLAKFNWLGFPRVETVGETVFRTRREAMQHAFEKLQDEREETLCYLRELENRIEQLRKELQDV